jgi:predicted methyltransferase
VDIFRLAPVVVLLGAIGFTVAAQAANPVPDYVTASVADKTRGDDAKADMRRKPAELMAFAGVKPGDTVVDLIPGGGYFTRIFAKIVGPNGHVYAVWPEAYAKEDAEDVAATQKLPQTYPNVSVIVQPAAQFSVPTKIDVVWTSQNYHDYPDKFMGPTDPAGLDRQVLAALKPGGVFVVVDHVAEAGSGLRDTDTLHRIDPAFVKAQATAAGFTFDGESDVLRNPADDHTLVVFKPAIRGHTDQFAYRFRKPQ